MCVFLVCYEFGESSAMMMIVDMSDRITVMNMTMLSCAQCFHVKSVLMYVYAVIMICIEIQQVMHLNSVFSGFMCMIFKLVARAGFESAFLP